MPNSLTSGSLSLATGTEIVVKKFYGPRISEVKSCMSRSPKSSVVCYNLQVSVCTYNRRSKICCTCSWNFVHINFFFLKHEITEPWLSEKFGYEDICSKKIVKGFWGQHFWQTNLCSSLIVIYNDSHFVRRALLMEEASFCIKARPNLHNWQMLERSAVSWKFKVRPWQPEYELVSLTSEQLYFF